MDLGLAGKVALITGGTHGLGKQVALALAREGCKVSVCGRGEERLAAMLKECTDLGYQAMGTQADVTREDDVIRFHHDTVEELGPPDILVNNVGGRRGSAIFEETSLDQFRESLELNLVSAFNLTSMVVPSMKSRKWGRIVNIASIWGREYGGAIDYMVGKAGLIAFSKHLAMQLVAHNVLVNCVAPGSIDFPGSSWDRFQKNNSPETVAEFIDRNLPAGRFGWPAPIGEMVAFLSSDRADLVSGACINVDGGQSRSLI